MEWSRSSKERFASKLRALKPFDPYHSPLCTCGPKLTLNVYTGCGFEGLYCYTTTYSRGRWGRDSEAWGPRAGVVRDLERDIARIADTVLALEAPYKTAPEDGLPSIQYAGSLFEQGLLILTDAIALEVARTLGKTPGEMGQRHANLE